MAVRKLKPVTPGQRHKLVSAFDTITKSQPEKSLLRPLKKTGVRNSSGRRTVRYKGGGHKQRYRIIDFHRNKDGMESIVKTIEYDPNRNARIALVVYKDGEKRYIIAPIGLEVGMTVISSKKATPINVGNRLPLEKVPMGMMVYGVELVPGKGA